MGGSRRRGTQVHLARRTVVPAWLEEKPKEKGSMLEEPGIEAGGDLEKASVAPKRQARRIGSLGSSVHGILFAE
jgi:hypothetical protein